MTLHTILGFIVLWSLGFACYWMGRRFEEDKWIRILIGFGQDIDRRAAAHRAALKAAAAASPHTNTAAANRKEST